MASSADVWACPKCTFHNMSDAMHCELCFQSRPCKSKPTITSSIPPLPSYNKEEPDDDDDAMSDFDMTQYDDSHKNHENNDNTNNKREKTPEISLVSNGDNDEDFDPDYNDGHDDYFDNDDELENVLQTSRIEAAKHAETQAKCRRLSQEFAEFGSEENQLEIAKKLSMQVGNYSNNSTLFGDHQHLFAGFSSNTNNKNTNNANDIDIDTIDMPDINNRKRKRNIENDSESPPKKRKIDDENKPKKRRKKKKKDMDEKSELDDEFTEMHLNGNNDIFEAVDPETLPKKQRNRIETAYQKFLTCYLKGDYSLRTVCIEYGPKFKGRSAAFTNILSDTKWRPASLALPASTAFESIDNMSLPAHVCRFKHYTLNTGNKSLIFGGCNNEQEMEKLHGMKKDGLGQYFLPRLLNKNRCIYSSYVMVRLNWTDFKRVWNEKRFMALIEEVRELDGVGIVNICLENVAQTISKIQNKNQQVGTEYDDSSPFADEQELKNRMIGYYFEDKLLHFLYKRNQKETAEHIIRVARSIADARFKKIRVNQLTISDHNSKGIRGKNKTNKDVFFLSLVPMHNLSEKKATGITQKYPTIGALMREYKRRNENEGEMLLADIRTTLSSARIGPAISKRVYNVFYKNTDGDKKMNA